MRVRPSDFEAKEVMAYFFRPTDNGEDDKFRSVEIKIASNQGKDKKSIVRTKRGYYFRRRSG